MPLLSFQRLSAWDLVYALAMALASVITYHVMALIVPLLMNRSADSVEILWAVISAVYVFRDTRAHSSSAAISRLIATGISVALCSIYLLLFPANALALIILITMSALTMMLLGRRDDIGLTAITTAVVLIVAASTPQIAWLQPILRLMDTTVGIAVGISCKWAFSVLFYRVIGEDVR